MPPLATFSGTIQFNDLFATLTVDGNQDFALVHYSPLGNYSPYDEAASAAFFKNTKGLIDGDQLSVLGEQGQLGGQPVIFWVKTR